MSDQDYREGGPRKRYVLYGWKDEECEVCGGTGQVDIGTCPLCLGTGDTLVPVDPAAAYFVLRLDADPYARAAARVYADSVESENPLLAIELWGKLAEIDEKQCGTEAV